MPTRSKARKEEPAEAGSDIVMEEAPTSHQPESKDDDMSLPGSTPTAASFEFLNEGHTLGNALRYVINRNPEVEFCAYAIPHPSEPKMTVRIQTFEGTTAIEALEKGLRDLQDLCDVVTDKFIEARERFSAGASS
ncbi:RBP11-like subunits of RNA polymerase [Canariomyces notabilis]|uniref:RBP11-like subunits of RNA polymerase n=1 Tax=Canariomyces notabilis TaxID=2074819 RepID=A0AAN6TII3_9PEZI|nr:RBP11-like subunits of RNA polymerase [Canariomyces arenarius]